MKSYNSVNFNPELALTAFRTILPCFQQVNQTWARDPMENQHSESGQLKNKTRDLSERWSRDMATSY